MSLNINESKFEEACERESIDDPEINQIKQIDIYKDEEVEGIWTFTNILLDSFVDTSMKKIPAL